MNHDISFPFPISAPIPAQASFTDKNRLSLLRSSSDDEPDSEHQTHHHHYHMHHHHQLNQTVSEKGKKNYSMLLDQTRFYIWHARPT